MKDNLPARSEQQTGVLDLRTHRNVSEMEFGLLICSVILMILLQGREFALDSLKLISTFSDINPSLLIIESNSQPLR